MHAMGTSIMNLEEEEAEHGGALFPGLLLWLLSLIPHSTQGHRARGDTCHRDQGPLYPTGHSGRSIFLVEVPSSKVRLWLLLSSRKTS